MPFTSSGRRQIPVILRLSWFGVVTSYLISALSASVVITVPPEPLVAPPGLSDPVELELDSDDVIDFIFQGNSSRIDVLPQGANQVLMFDEEFGPDFPADLGEGSFIGATPGAGMLWSSETPILSGCASGGGGVSCGGNFLGGIDYLGVEFDISGNTHYGWVEIESNQFFHVANILRWAYESEPGIGIVAGRVPEPSAVVLLLFSGIAMVSRRAR